MSLPPERIVLKRRRGEEAVDCLYLQESRDKKIRSDFHWAKISDNAAVSSDFASARSSVAAKRSAAFESKIDSHAPQVPTIVSTLPQADSSDLHDKDLHLSDGLEADIQTRGPPVKSEVNCRAQRPLLPSKTRHFHLIKDSFLNPSHVSAGHGISKHRSKGRASIAMFTERHPADALRLMHSDRFSEQGATSTECKDPGERSFRPLGSGPKKHKRPNATAEEVRWRAKNWNKDALSHRIDEPVHESFPNKSKGFSSYSDHSLELAMQLQEFAMQEIQSDIEEPSDRASTAQVHNGPVHPCDSDRQNICAHIQKTEETNVVANVDVLENNDDFIYDTFLRSEGIIQVDLSEGVPIPIQSSTKNRSREVGVLVIEEQDEKAWQEYAEDNNSDKEWDTDEEDENAEDYYGNDYPEDEVDSDDEFNRDAYKYREYASDDEEYDEKSDVRSDDSGEDVYPFRAPTHTNTDVRHGGVAA